MIHPDLTVIELRERVRREEEQAMRAREADEGIHTQSIQPNHN